MYLTCKLLKDFKQLQKLHKSDDNSFYLRHKLLSKKELKNFK